MPTLLIGLASKDPAPGLNAPAWRVAVETADPVDFPPLPGYAPNTNELSFPRGLSDLQGWAKSVGLSGLFFNHDDGLLRQRLALIPPWLLERFDFAVEQYETTHPDAEPGFQVGFDFDLGMLRRLQYWSAWAASESTVDTPAAIQYVP